MDSKLKWFLEAVINPVRGFLSVRQSPSVKTYADIVSFQDSTRVVEIRLMERLGGAANYLLISVNQDGELHYTNDKENIRKPFPGGIEAGTPLEFHNENIISVLYVPDTYPATMEIFGSV